MDSLCAICDRIAVLLEKRVWIADTLERVAARPSLDEYFHGPRGRAVLAAAGFDHPMESI